MNKNNDFAYGRVSTKQQSADRQIDSFLTLGISERNIFIDHQSGKEWNREKYTTLRDHILRPGDRLTIHELDRLGRTKSKILSELRHLQSLGVIVRIMDIPTTMQEWPEESKWVRDMVTTILIEVYASQAEQELIRSKKRQAEGIAAALARNVKFGNKPIQKPANWDEVINEWQAGKITAKKAMSLLNLKPTTFYKLVKEDQSVSIMSAKKASNAARTTDD